MKTCITSIFLLLIFVIQLTAQEALKPTLILNHTGYCCDNMAFSPDETMLTTYGESPVNIWNLENGELIQSIQPRSPLQSTAFFSLDGLEILISSRGYIEVFDITTGKMKASYNLQSFFNTLSVQSKTKVQENDIISPQCYQEFSNAVLFNNGKMLAVGSDYEYAMIWSMENKAPFLYLKLTGFINNLSIHVSPDNKRIAVKDNNQIQIWNIYEGFRGNSHIISNRHTTAFSFSHDGSHMLAASDDMIRVFDSDSGALVDELIEFDAKDRRLLELASLSPDGSLFHSNKTIWNLNDCRIIAKLEHEAIAQGSSIFSPNKKYLAQRTEDGDILIWDISQIEQTTEVPTSMMH